MVSIIICSRTKVISKCLLKNIENTVCSDYELIVIDNSQNEYSIFEAYNLGIKKSTGQYLCFMHDDIFIHTIGWGDIIKKTFEENETIGLLGIAGAKVKTKMPSGWWNCNNEFKVINIIQHIGNNEVEKWYCGFDFGSISEVVILDGVFMVMKKSTKVFFSNELRGFHNYDFNISLECKKKGFKNFVTNEILIEHYSNGNTSKLWYESTIKAHEIYGDYLPLITNDIRYLISINSLEYKNAIRFINQAYDLNFKYKAFQIWLKLILLKPYSKFHLRFLKKIINHKFF